MRFIFKEQSLISMVYLWRVQFAEWYLNKINDESKFHRSILWINEAFFAPSDYFNTRNSHILREENPSAVRRLLNELTFSV